MGSINTNNSSDHKNHQMRQSSLQHHKHCGLRKTLVLFLSHSPLEMGEMITVLSCETLVFLQPSLNRGRRQAAGHVLLEQKKPAGHKYSSSASKLRRCNLKPCRFLLLHIYWSDGRPVQELVGCHKRAVQTLGTRRLVRFCLLKVCEKDRVFHKDVFCTYS